MTGLFDGISILGIIVVTGIVIGYAIYRHWFLG